MVQAIERGMEILSLLREHPLGVTELSNQTLLPKATVHRLLKTFENYHWVEMEPVSKKYRLSWGILPYTKAYLASLDVRAIAEPYMALIRKELQQSVNLYVAHGEHRVCVERMAADKPLRSDIRVGTVYPIFRGAAGKIFSAYLKEEESQTDASIEIRRVGYVVTRGERVPDAASIAVPIFSFGNKLEAVLTISGSIGDYGEEVLPRYISVVVESGKKISAAMGAIF